MKKALALFFFAAMVISGHGQERSGFIGIQAGPSIPVGSYNAVELPDGGFASVGFSSSIEGAWYFLPWLGVGGQLGVHVQTVNAAALETAKEQSDPFIIEAYITSDPYRNYTLYAGAYFQVPIMQRLSFTAKMLGGAMYSQSPYQYYTIDYFMIGLKTFEVTSSGDYEWSFLSGAGLTYQLNNRLGFTLNGEFTYNQDEFDFKLPDGSTRTDDRVISFVNVLAGVYWKL